MSNIIRWDPFREMMAFRSAMDRLIDSTLASPGFAWESENIGIAADIYENPDDFVVKMSLPGVSPDDLEITYNNNVITVKGELKTEKEVEETRYHLRERRFGSFSRSFSLPASVDGDSVKATFDQGVLTLTLPKAEEAKPKRIAIKQATLLEAKIADNKN